MLLVLDIGNSNIVAGVYRGEVLERSWRFATDERRTADEIAGLLSDCMRRAGLRTAAVTGAALASVVPSMDRAVQEAVRAVFGVEVLVVGPHLDLGLKVDVRNPEEVGADRLVNAVAARHAHAGPLLVLDFGTATTVDAVSADGRYLGGAIAPGVAISVEALFSRTARLPRIEMAPPEAAIGDCTLAAMRSGIYYGTVGATRELCARLGDELRRRDGRPPLLIATGGLSHWLAEADLGVVELIPDLTLTGLRLVWQRNRPRSGRRRR